MRSARASELSGLVLSRTREGLLWAHNDSGGEPRLLAFATDGAARGDVLPTGAENVDWEAIAVAGDTLYVGDIGDNAARRPHVAVYAVREPRDPPASVRVRARRIELRYPDGPRDAEALVADPSSGALVIVAKSLDGDTWAYATRGGPRPGTLRRIARVELGPAAAITAADVSADGRTVVLRGYERAYVFARRGDEPLARTLARRPCVAGADLAHEGQGEALALGADGRGFFTAPEGRNPALRRYGRGLSFRSTGIP